MDEENNKSQNENQPRRFNQEQYDLLKKCSDKKDITEWNWYRIDNRNKDIELEGASFYEYFLKGVFLNCGLAKFEGRKTHFRGKVYLEGAVFDEANLEGASLSDAHMNEVVFRSAHLEYSDFADAHLERTDFFGANLGKANFNDADLKGVCFLRACLEGADFTGAKLEETKFWWSHSEKVIFDRAVLNGTDFVGAGLEGARFDMANLGGASFRNSVVNNETTAFNCIVNKKTDFRDVAIDSMRMNSGIKQLLKHNMRRLNWDDWYKEHKILKWPVWLFWQISDYGNSTLRIIWWFFGVAAVFAAIYYFVPGLIENLRVEGSCFLNTVRAFYFSIITMVTGFEAINPNDKSIAGHILLAVQVILGYVLLGALVARLAILFTGEGPAGKFSNEKK